MLDGPTDGAMNMAIDRAVLDRHCCGESPPTLRLYAWGSPTVSLGRFQRVEQVDLDVCRRRGIGVVRRPTGGRGVLHDDELTYSVVAGVADGVPRGVAASYRYLGEALTAALGAIGVPAAITDRQRGMNDTGACYLHATKADLSLGRAKLSGGAQVWRGESVLQHGSLVISRDVSVEAEVFRLDAAHRQALDADAMTLTRALGSAPSIEDLIEALTAAFAATLGVRLSRGSLTAPEMVLASAWAAGHLVVVRSADAASHRG